MTELNVTSATAIITPQLGSSWGGTVLYLGLFVFLPLGIIAIGLAVLWNIANYTRFKKYIGWISESVQYAIIGAVSIIVLSIPMGLIYWGYTQARRGNTVPFRYTFYFIVGYLILVFIGYIVKNWVIDRVQMFEKELEKKKRKELKNWVKEGGINDK